MWWMWTKRVFFVVASVWLLFGAFQRLYYFHDEMIYGDRKLLNPSYASQVQVETYLMSKQNLIDLFEGKPPNPDTSPFPKNKYLSDYYEDPFNPRYYLVFRLKNQGDKTAWGSLDLFVEGEKDRRIDIPPLPPNMTDFEIMAVMASAKDRNEFSANRNYPAINASWSLLYTKKMEKYK